MILPKLRLPSSQQLRFINKLYYPTTPIRWDTRLFPDFAFDDKECGNYNQKINVGDRLWIQYRTSYNRVDVHLVDAKTQLSVQQYMSTMIHEYVDTDGTTMYMNEVVIDTSLAGKYYVQVIGNSYDMPYVPFTSETFHIGNWDDTQVHKWGGNTTISDGMRWGGTPYLISNYQQIRIRSRIIDIKFGTNKSTYVDSANELTTLSAYPNSTHILEVSEIPYYLIERLSLALQHDEYYVDGMMYNVDEEFDLTTFKYRTVSTGIIPLRQVVYENYSSDPILTGDIPIFPDEIRTTGLEDRGTGIEDRKYNN